ncbi:class I SAM-dependent methyltransferase [Patescibacteria group bacterium]|nr:class I SAM-dependent methyltransferase [Patescibacteria group bacterium]
MKNETIKSQWRQFAQQWALYGPPQRPSRSEVGVFSQLLKDLPAHSKGLVLGSTPELRDLLHDHGLEVTVVDIQPLVIKILRDFMENKDRSENEVEASWLDTPFVSQKFNVIVGDWIFGNVPFAEQDNLTKEIHRILKNDGYFIHRHHYFYQPRKKITDILSEYGDLKKINENWLVFDLVLLSTTPQNSYVQSPRVVKEELQHHIKKSAKENRVLLQKYHDIFHQQLPRDDKLWWYGPRAGMEAIYQKYFDIAAVKYGNDHKFTDICPIYFLKKK